MMIAAMLYHVISFVLQAGQRVLAQLARLPQVGHLMLYPRISILEELNRHAFWSCGTLAYRARLEVSQLEQKF